MRNRKLVILIPALAGCLCLLSGCDQVDESMLTSEINTAVNISVPFVTATPIPEYLDVPDPVVIDTNGVVTVNDKSILSSANNARSDEQSGYSTLSLGDTGFAVQTLQQRLKDLGYFGEGVSGIFDAATETAVKRFEQTYGIMQTGIATVDFQTRLFAASAVTYGTNAYDSAVVSHYTTLQRGAVGSSVYALQHRLQELGYPIRELTGVYDEETEEAVKLFYAAYDLEPQAVAYIALQKELYADDARPYTIDGEVQVVEEDATTLSSGNVGTLVMQIQNRLSELGYLSAAPSGIFDADTEAAVKLFEEACGVEPTGKLPYALQAILLSDQAPRYGAVYSEEEREYVDLSEGSTGDEVLALQTRLIELGYASGAGNGVYGEETAAALKMFQRYNGLEQTGQATAEVQKALYSYSAITYQDVLNGVTSRASLADAAQQAEPTATPQPELPVVVDKRTLSVGTSGDDVSELQQRLVDLGYDCPTGGEYDEATAEAVRAMQSAVGVSQTGEASHAFCQYILSKAAPQKGVQMYNATQTYVTLQQGDEGESVTNLQKRLWELGYLLTDDVKDSVGTFHDKTAEAVSAAQRAMEYKETDGVASAEFQCFLFSEYGKYIKK